MCVHTGVVDDDVVVAMARSNVVAKFVGGPKSIEDNRKASIPSSKRLDEEEWTLLAALNVLRLDEPSVVVLFLGDELFELLLVDGGREDDGREDDESINPRSLRSLDNLDLTDSRA
mmetsp:Transcript_31749/g.47179  ORF Transcript_31749/g.47179 Transcript_31749/m.47179 type:complete len:116 (-) Transcript_31749:1407-1754(-)